MTRSEAAKPAGRNGYGNDGSATVITDGDEGNQSRENKTGSA
jgi:hypothetical protein